MIQQDEMFGFECRQSFCQRTANRPTSTCEQNHLVAHEMHYSGSFQDHLQPNPIFSTSHIPAGGPYLASSLRISSSHGLLSSYGVICPLFPKQERELDWVLDSKRGWDAFPCAIQPRSGEAVSQVDESDALRRDHPNYILKGLAPISRVHGTAISCSSKAHRYPTFHRARFRKWRHSGFGVSTPRDTSAVLRLFESRRCG